VRRLSPSQFGILHAISPPDTALRMSLMA
jgi:hypothetical protein